MSGRESTIVVLRLWSKASKLNHSTIYSPIYFNTVHTVKPVIKGHLWDKEKGDLLIQVTAWTGLIVYLFYLLFKIFMFQWLVWSPSYHSNEVLCQHKRYSFTIYSKFLLSMIHKMSKIYMENLQRKKKNYFTNCNSRCLLPLMTFVKWFVTDCWFSPGTPVSSINKNDCHNITEILLKVVLNPITPL